MDRLLRLCGNLSETHLREILLASSFGLAIKILSAISIFAMNIVVARTLGASEAGLFFLAMTMITIFAAVSRLGLDQTLVRFIAAEQVTGDASSLHGVYRKSVKWTFLASLLLTLVIAESTEFPLLDLIMLPDFSPVFKIAMFAIPLVALYTLLAHALQGLKNIVGSMLILNVMVPVILLLMMLWAPTKLAGTLSLYYVLACLVTLLLGFIFWKQSAPETPVITSFSSSRLYQACLPLWGVTILAQVIQWSSQIMLGIWSTAEEVAFFATAQRTAMLTSFVLFAVNAIAAPKFAAMHAQNDTEGLKKTAILSVRLMLVAAIPALAVMLLFPEWLMSFFGDEFKAAATALVILSLGQFVNIATGSVGYLLSMTGLERKVRDNMVISTTLGLILGLTLIPSFGLTGAAIATASAIASQNLLGVYQVRKYLGFNTLVFWR